MATFLAVLLAVTLTSSVSLTSGAPQQALFLQRPLRQLQQPQAAQSRQQEPIAIVKLSSDVSHDGNFVYEFEGANGIRSEVQGTLKNAGQKGLESQTVTGSFSFVGDDGQTYSIQYTADENGYQPQGAHLPTPPPIPDAILKALEFIARNPPPPENQDAAVSRPQQQLPRTRS